MKKICELCNTEYNVSPSRYKSSKYCSNKCRLSYQKSNAQKQHNLHCETCNKEIVVYESHLKNHHYCSTKCMGIAMRNKTLWFDKIKGSANERGIEFNITIDYLMDLINKQEYKCGLTGLNIKISEYQQDKESTASLDRINPDIGYIEGNVMWVHKNINQMKWLFDHDTLIAYCTLISIKFPISIEQCNTILSTTKEYHSIKRNKSKKSK